MLALLLYVHGQLVVRGQPRAIVVVATATAAAAADDAHVLVPVSLPVSLSVSLSLSVSSVGGAAQGPRRPGDARDVGLS
ncbi:hypothetical protein F5Y07DRAFT_384781 [Xylaria sp. FL0933]|nr:hypothetical protein F5Y07DRAFT_384781 [Xylaria sp. FL0933]